MILDVINPAGGVPADRVAGLPADPQTIAALQRLWRNERHTKGGPLGSIKRRSTPWAAVSMRYPAVSHTLRQSFFPDLHQRNQRHIGRWTALFR